MAGYILNCYISADDPDDRKCPWNNAYRIQSFDLALWVKNLAQRELVFVGKEVSSSLRTIAHALLRFHIKPSLSKIRR